MKRTSGLRVVAGRDFTQPEAGAPWHPLAARGHQPVDNRSTTPTAVNSRLRSERRKMWRRAEALTRYWLVMLDMESAIGIAKTYGAVPQPAWCSLLPGDRNTICAKWREALVQQLRTPAHDLNSLKWKQDVLAKERYDYTGITPERLKHLIAEDVAWLAAHPTRRSKPMVAQSEPESGGRCELMDILDR